MLCGYFEEAPSRECTYLCEDWSQVLVTSGNVLLFVEAALQEAVEVLCFIHWITFAVEKTIDSKPICVDLPINIAIGTSKQVRVEKSVQGAFW